jgi:hypothetical protein
MILRGMRLSAINEAIAVCYYGGQFLTRLIRPAQAVDWRRLPARPDPTKIDPFDIPTLFFGQVAKGFPCVAEIGSWDGRRIMAVKAALPELIAHGFDLCENLLQRHDRRCAIRTILD